MYALQPFQANQRGNSVQISENTIAENVSDPNETPEVIQAVYKLIVAVDIGTTYTKVAWSRTVTPPAEPEPHLFVDGQWEDQRQVPTAVLYRPSQHRHRSLEFDSFGHEAIRRYRGGKPGWALLQRFKMELHQKKVGILSFYTYQVSYIHTLLVFSDCFSSLTIYDRILTKRLK